VLELVLASLAVAALVSLVIDLAHLARGFAKASISLRRRIRRRRLAPIDWTAASATPVAIVHAVDATENSFAGGLVGKPKEEMPIRRLKDVSADL